MTTANTQGTVGWVGLGAMGLGMATVCLITGPVSAVLITDVVSRLKRLQSPSIRCLPALIGQSGQGRLCSLCLASRDDQGRFSAGIDGRQYQSS